MTDRGVDFETTMRGLESGLRVEEIATFSMADCAPDQEVEPLLEEMEASAFDQYPVREDGHIVGILDRFDVQGGPLVKDGMIRLRESMLVSASDSLGTLMPLLDTSRYRLVVRQGKIAGIVTHSDLIKLPVRLFAFAKITYLEMLMAEIIARALPAQESWMPLLSEARQGKVKEKIDEAKSVRLDPSPLEFTDFCDKRTILKKHRGLGKRFEKDLVEVEEVRNVLAHAGNYGHSVEDLQSFMRGLRLAEKWIKEFEDVKRDTGA